MSARSDYFRFRVSGWKLGPWTLQDYSGFIVDHLWRALEGHYSFKGRFCQDILWRFWSRGAQCCVKSLVVAEAGHALLFTATEKWGCTETPSTTQSCSCEDASGSKRSHWYSFLPEDNSLLLQSPQFCLLHLTPPPPTVHTLNSVFRSSCEE